MHDVTEYGATGNGATDDTASIQSAIDAAAAASGGLVYFPGGKTYRVTAALKINADRTSVRGDGTSSIIKIDSSNSNVFNINSAVGEMTISDLKIINGFASDPTSGYCISLNARGILWVLIRDIVFGDADPSLGVWGMIGCTLPPAPSAFVNNVVITNCIGRKIKGIGIQFQSGTDWCILNSLVEMDGTFSGTRGLLLETNSEGLYATNVLFLGGEYSISSSHSFAGAPPKQHNFLQVAGDGAGVASWHVTAGKRYRMVNCWAASVQPNATGVSIDDPIGQTSDIVWKSGIVLNCGANGIRLSSGRRIFIEGAHVLSNSRTSANSYNGISIGANASDFVICGCYIYNDPDFDPNRQKHGIAVNAGSSDNYMITNNYLRGNGDVGLADFGTGMNKIVTNNLT